MEVSCQNNFGSIIGQEVTNVPTWLEDRWALKSLDVVARKKVFIPSRNSTLAIQPVTLIMFSY